ncbi:MAG TPA: efflux RND transporter periplasmic adaptor subunit [Bacteroidales bacterium]|nr:efflux RND transporter periplasmic adaptor subunit [Bacteroidales bacterium]
MKKTVKLWILLSAGLILIILLGYGFKKSMTGKKINAAPVKAESLLKVDALVVEPSHLVDEISVSGSLLAYDEVALKSETGGRVVNLHLPEGQFVKKGTLLVKLFDDDLQANLKKLKSQLAIQQQIFDRQSELFKVNGISQNDYEQTSLQLETLKADIDIQEALIRKTMVLAPFDGIVGLRNISMGAQVTTSTLLATIRSNGKLKLDFSIPEKYGPIIRPGMKVRFSLYNTDNEYEATVFATEHGIDADTRNLKVRALVKSADPALIPGAFTNVSLNLGEKDHALLVPTKSIIPHEQKKSLIVARKGKAHIIDVKTGVRQSGNIEILEGIQSGDTIITNGLLFLKEGRKLIYSNIKTGAV